MLEPCDGKLSRTVLRGESPRKGADLLDAHILLVDTGNSYKGLCRLIHERTRGEDGIYITYEEDRPITFNPFYSEDRQFDVEKRESIKTLILTLWKREDELPKRSEEVALSGAVNAYIRRITENPELRPDFNGFYEFVRDDYRRMMEKKRVREKDFDIDGFLNVLEPFYKGGDYDFLLNSDKEIDLTHKRFIVFELDNISSNKVLLPVVTLIIMETFISKMRRLKGIRKVILLEEAWKSLMSPNMAAYILYLFKTVRKYFGEAVVVTQEVDDIISSPIVKEAIINNSDCKILLDQRKYLNKFERIQTLLGLTDKECSQILSINRANDPSRRYKEVWIGLGGVQSAVYATETSTAEYDGGEREAGSGTDGGKDRQHGTGHTDTGRRKEQRQEIIFVKHLKERFNETKNFQRIVRLFTYRTVHARAMGGDRPGQPGAGHREQRQRDGGDFRDGAERHVHLQGGLENL